MPGNKRCRAPEDAACDALPTGTPKYCGTLLNRIISIARTNPQFAQQLQRGFELLTQIGYRDGSVDQNW
jgi:hypothetical protein